MESGRRSGINGEGLASGEEGVKSGGEGWSQRWKDGVREKRWRQWGKERVVKGGWGRVRKEGMEGWSQNWRVTVIDGAWYSHDDEPGDRSNRQKIDVQFKRRKRRKWEEQRDSDTC